MKNVLLAPFVLAALLCPNPGFGQNRPQSRAISGTNLQPAPWPAPPQGIEMGAVSTLRQDPLGPKLGNGTEARAEDWPASFFGIYQVGGQPFVCTATLVGKRTLLTAAHCLGDDGRLTITLQDKSYVARCDKPDGAYPVTMSLDVALCLTNQPVPVQAIERLNLNPRDIKRGMTLLLAGFGCTRLGGELDKKFRTGPAFVKEMPGELPPDIYWLATYPPRERPGAFICPGDSGGAVYRSIAGKRDVVAINSHYDTAGTGISFLTTLSVPKVSDFIRGWADRHRQRICGVHDDALDCN